jgi:type II secretory pathway predicted ATPase ExeA
MTERRIMNLAFWGFRRWPFERSLAMDRFFPSASHEEALSRMLFLVEESRRVGVVAGPAGTGKTLLLKVLQQLAERMGRLTVRTDATGFDRHELISEIAAGCHVDCELDTTVSRIWNGLHKRFTGLSIIQQPVVIVIDHLDMADSSCLTIVCRLCQLADSLGVNLTIVLATREPLIPAELQELVDLRIEIAAWDQRETAEFIHDCVNQSGYQHPLFTDDAIACIHDATDGIPAMIVSLCNLALLAAQGRDSRLVTHQIAEAAYRELMPSPALHRFPQSSPDAQTATAFWTR